MKIEVSDKTGGKLIRITQEPIKIAGIETDKETMEIFVKYIHNGSVGGSCIKIIK